MAAVLLYFSCVGGALTRTSGRSLALNQRNGGAPLYREQEMASSRTSLEARLIQVRMLSQPPLVLDAIRYLLHLVLVGVFGAALSSFVAKATRRWSGSTGSNASNSLQRYRSSRIYVVE